MCTNTPRKRGSRLAFLAPVMLSLLLSAAHADDKNVAKAKEYYAAGMQAFNEGRWQPAVKNFKASYDLYAHSTTAYMMSCAYLQLENPGRAEAFAILALQEQPRLQEPYATDARTILLWATEAKNDDYYRLSGKGDVPGRPASPKSPPPRPATPAQVALSPKPGPIGFMTKVIIAADLSGQWHCNDGGTYFLRQVGDELWWYGQSPDGGKSWSNVFHGELNGNQIVGKWANVPHGRTQNAGEMTLEIVDGKLKATRRTGDFGGNEWSR
ncbi:MAG: hypothetical protein ACE5IY_01430 [bacterium]